MAGVTKSGGQKDALDKFYTKPEIAAALIAKTRIAGYTTIIEPSAGSGSFSNQITGCIGLDLKPEGTGISQQDFFTYSHPKTEDERILVIGNPPFGQQNSIAIRFMTHAAGFADRIAFVLPISFKKESVQNRINPYFHLTYEEELPKNSFTFNEDDYNVRCVFQIWDRQDTPRVKASRGDLNSNNLFEFVKKNDSPDAFIHRVGGRAGKASIDWTGKDEINHYFIRFKPGTTESVDSLIERLNMVVYPGRDHAVGPRSVSKKELNAEVNKLFA